MSSHYETLGVERTATSEEIQKAYRKFARQYHPDVNPSEEAIDKFKQIQSAYEVLGDEDRRRQYDAQFNRKPFNSIYDDFFNQMFHERQQANAKGRTIIVEIPVTLEQVEDGGSVQVKYSVRPLCEKCHGKGGIEEKCPHCDGEGVRMIYGTVMTVKTNCHGCGGTGKVIISSCDHCQQGFMEPVENSLNFDIPRGVQTGSQYLCPGKGEASVNGPPGDVLAVVKVLPHSTFHLLPQANLLLELPLSYTQLVLGAKVSVPTLKSKASLKIPPGTVPDTRFRLKGQGLPVFNKSGDIYKRGDQYVLVKLDVPSDVKGEHRELLEKLSEIERQDVTPLREAFLKKLGE